MSISNLNNVHFTEEQITVVNNALTALEKSLETIKINLTPEDRNRYGRVNEQNKLFINKVADFAQSQAELRVPDVDWEEFFKDTKSRKLLEQILNRLGALSTKVQNAKILYDYDSYQDALADYAYTSYKANSNSVGFEFKYKELKQFFTRNRRKQATEGNSLPTDKPNQDTEN